MKSRRPTTFAGRVTPGLGYRLCMKTIIRTPDAPSSPLFNQGVVAGPFIYVSGMTGTDVATGQLAGPGIQ